MDETPSSPKLWFTKCRLSNTLAFTVHSSLQKSTGLWPAKTKREPFIDRKIEIFSSNMIVI